MNLDLMDQVLKPLILNCQLKILTLKLKLIIDDLSIQDLLSCNLLSSVFIEAKLKHHVYYHHLIGNDEKYFITFFKVLNDLLLIG